MTTTTFGGFPDIMFDTIPLLAVLGFALVLGVIIALLIKNAGQWNKNNHSPVITVDAVVGYQKNKCGSSQCRDE